MKVDVTEIGPCRRKVTVEIEPEMIEERIKDKVREYRRTRSIPGFRPGRATEGIIRQRFGKEIRSSVLRDLIPDVWTDALRENNLVPMSQPDMEPMDPEEGGGLKIVGSVDIRPQVDIDGYSGLKAKRTVRPVADEDVDRQLEMIRQQRADEVAVERSAAKGDIVVGTVQKVDENGVVIIGEEAKERRWELGGIGSLSHDLDEQLIGINAGETRTISFTYREDLYDENRAGKQDRGNVTIKEIYERDVPELDDEFAKDLGDFQTVDDLRKAIREDLEARSRAASSREVQAQLREQIEGKYDFDVPESLVERMIHGMFHEHEQAKEHEKGEEGDEHEHSHTEEGTEEHDAALAAFTEEHREEALKRVRAMLALDLIAEKENLEVSDDQVRQRVAMMAAQYRMAPDQMMQYLANSGRLGSIRAEMLDQAVLRLLEEKADIEEVEAEPEKDEAAS